jgi:hypothetical protein
VFIDTQQVTISPLAAIDVPSLVRGWCLDITSASTCRTVSQRLKITGVKVTENRGDENTPGAESVQVQVAARKDDRTVLVALEEVTGWYAVVRVWRSRPRRGQGVAEPAGPSVRVHAVRGGKAGQPFTGASVPS